MALSRGKLVEIVPLVTNSRTKTDSEKKTLEMTLSKGKFVEIVPFVTNRSSVPQESRPSKMCVQ